MLELLEREIKFRDGARRASRIRHEHGTQATSAGMTGNSLRLHTTGAKQRSNKYCMAVVSVERCGAVNEQLRGGKDYK